MTKAKPCRHARWTVIKRTAESEHYEEDGKCVPHPDPRKHYRVLEVLRCVKCNTAGTRWSRFYAATARTALKRAGVPEELLPLPPNYKPKPLTTAAVTGWPFPVSGHDWNQGEKNG
jgi:hypothetical protein